MIALVTGYIVTYHEAEKTHTLPVAQGLSDQLEAGIDILEINCGSGRAICSLVGAPSTRASRRTTFAGTRSRWAKR